MASAAPLLAGLFASTAVSKIGQNQGWSPVLTGLLSMAAGAGVGSIGAGIGAANASGSLAGSTAMSVNPHAGFSVGKIAPTLSPFAVSANPHIGMGTKNIGNFSSALTGVPHNPHFNPLHTQGGTVPTVGGGPLNSGPLYDPMTTPRGSLSAKPNYFGSQSDAPTYIQGGLPSKQDAFIQGTKNAWNQTWSDPNFQYAMGAQVIDGMFAEPPRKQPIGGGGGGGGGAMAPAYSAGGAGQGQYKVIGGFPERKPTIEWQEVA